MSLPGADELFRTTGGMALQASSAGSARQHANGEKSGAAPRVPAPAGESDPVSSSDEDGPGSDASPAADEDAGSAEHSGRENDQDHPSAVRTSAQAGPKGRPERDGPPAAAQVPGARPAAGQHPSAQAGAGQPRRGTRGANRRPSGRERHDEKITVYVSAEELMDLEHARLVLRGEHGLAVDRGRIVREAVAVVLADLESRGDASILVRRLRGR
ncbi:hypothetical protein ABZW18_07925 [Streptomyces sp. NPDC004647]|uniref:hypothetical protein n=1 Tax=Streptomyces sp. NPDC004647 TaxID=3154671 RepID=UPI0033A185C2